MNDELVRWVVAAFMSNPGAEHDELVAVLRAAGVPRAHHACAIVPLAFGRQILEGLVELPATYELAGAPVAFADDPIFVAARDRAHHASRAQIERIGLFSAEVHAVNQALHRGSQPGDLVLSPPLVTIDAADAGTLARPAPLIAELVAAHGVSLPLEVRLFPSHVMRGRVQHQLDVIAEGAIMESFAGLGHTVAESLADSIHKLARGSLHVLLAMLVERTHGADQVTWERWGDFEVCAGPLLRLWAPGPDVDRAALLDALKPALAGLPRRRHWFRAFVAVHADGTPYDGVEALLDNEPFAPATEILARWRWPGADRDYAMRQFLMLVP